MRQVAVDPLIQRKGIGRKMVEFAENYCMRKGTFNEIRLHAREVAIPFYLSLGMEQFRRLEGLTSEAILFACFEKNFIVLFTESTVSVFSPRFERERLVIRRSSDNFTKTGFYCAFALKELNEKSIISTENTLTFDIFCGTSLGYVFTYTLKLFLKEKDWLETAGDSEEDITFNMSLKSLLRPSFSNIKRIIISKIDENILVIDENGSLYDCSTYSSSEIEKMDVGIDDGPLTRIRYNRIRESFFYLTTEDNYLRMRSLTEPSGASHIIYPDPVDIFEMQESSNVLVTSTKNNTVLVISVTSGELLCHVDCSDLGSINSISAHEFAPLFVVLINSQNILVLTFSGVTLFEYNTGTILSNCFFLRDGTLALTISDKIEDKECGSLMIINFGLDVAAISGDAFGAHMTLLFDQNISTFNPELLISSMPLRFGWRMAQITPEYAESCSTVKIVKYFPKAQITLISGERGFCFYVHGSRKWKLFGNQSQESSFSVIGAEVLDNVLFVLAAFDNRGGLYDILGFDLSDRLDLSLVKVKIPLKDKTLALTFWKSTHLVVLDSNHKIVFFNVSGVESSKVDNTYQVEDLLVGHEVSKLFIIYHHGDSLVIGILMDYRLTIFQSDENRQLNPLFSFNGFVEKVLVNQIVEESNDSMIIWLVWGNVLNAFQIDLQETLKVVSWLFDIQIENIISGIFYEYGAVVNLQYVQSNFESNLSNAKGSTYLLSPAAQYRFVIPELLYAFLSNRRDDIVAYVIEKYRNLPYFTYCMELLLHTLLEAESDSLVGLSSAAVLPRFVKIITNLDTFHEIVVGCARKSEMSLWNYLFSVVGDPKDLFDECMKLKRYHSATSYLIILYTMEPTLVSAKESVKLLEATLASEDYSLSSELHRFLKTVSQADGENGEKEQFYLDMMINRHLKKLLRRQRWRSLVTFARDMSFPLIPWLQQEKNLNEVKGSFAELIMEIYEQFDLDNVEDKQSISPLKMDRRKSDTSTSNLITGKESVSVERGRSSSWGKGSWKKGSSNNAQQNIIQELEDLNDAMFQSGWFSISLSSAILLRDEELLKRSLGEIKKSPEFRMEELLKVPAIFKGQRRLMYREFVEQKVLPLFQSTE